MVGSPGAPEDDPRPTGAEIARRSAVLAALVARGAAEYGGAAEHGGADAPPPGEVVAWLEGIGADALIDEDELGLLNSAAGSWGDDEIVDAGWRGEAAGVLLWSIGVVPEIFPYDRQFPDSHLSELTELMLTPWGLADQAGLVEYPALQSARDIAEIWHVRSMVEDAVRREEPPAGGVTFEAIVAELVEEALRLGAISRGAGADLEFLGRPYREITSDALLLAQSIAYERYAALVWLCGGAD